MAEKPAVLLIFSLTCLGLAAGKVPGLKLDRTGIAMLGAIATTIFGGFSTQSIIGFVNWPTILLLFGFFVLSAQLRLSGFFDLVAGRLADSLSHPVRFLFILMVATAGLSAFLNHDIVCFVFTPIVTTALLSRRLNPVPYLIALAIASNIGAAATIVGNPQDMMIAQIAGLGFGHYALWCLVPVIVALAAAGGIIYWLSKNNLAATNSTPSAATTTESPSFDRAHTIKGLVILVITIGLFLTSLPKEIVALTAAGIHLASPKFKTEQLLGLVDWPILILFMGLFVVTGALQTTGYGEQSVQWLAHAGFNLQSSPTLLVVTALLSNIIGNSGTVMLMLKVAHITQPPAAYVLALANSFGGSLIILGSVANIIVVQQARQMGVKISFGAFARLGIPVTLAAMAGLLVWVMVVA